MNVDVEIMPTLKKTVGGTIKTPETFIITDKFELPEEIYDQIYFQIKNIVYLDNLMKNIEYIHQNCPKKGQFTLDHQHGFFLMKNWALALYCVNEALQEISKEPVSQNIKKYLANEYKTITGTKNIVSFVELVRNSCHHASRYSTDSDKNFEVTFSNQKYDFLFVFDVLRVMTIHLMIVGNSIVKKE